MHPAVARILSRLAPLLAGVLAASKSDVYATTTPANANLEPGQDVSTKSNVGLSKLVFGTARKGQKWLASHRSHSSHSSHASHASHYSGSSSQTEQKPVDPAPQPPPAKKPPLINTPTVAPADRIADVLKKLPKIRSKWPAEITLAKKTYFNIYEGDKVTGIVTYDAGTVVKLVEIRVQHAVVQVGKGQSPLPVLNTDVIDRMGGLEAILRMPDDKQ